MPSLDGIDPFFSLRHHLFGLLSALVRSIVGVVECLFTFLFVVSSIPLYQIVCEILAFCYSLDMYVDYIKFSR
jgi:hypothetical protein